MSPGSLALLYASVAAIFLGLKLEIHELRKRLDKLEGEVEAKEKASPSRGDQDGVDRP